MSTPYYSDDLVTLYHGDCREVSAWLEADVLVTDPPYGVRWEAKFGDNRGPRDKRSRTTDVIANDATTAARDEALAMWGTRPAIVFGSWRMPRPERLHALLIWHKEGAYSALSTGPFFTNHEEVYALGPSWPKPIKPLRSVITTTEHRSQHTAQVGHPTPKPLGLMERLIEACPEGVIADPFVGSGSTLLAAKGLGRRAVGVELEERYCELAASRLAQDTLFGGVA
jgi:hypothetical protein